MAAPFEPNDYTHAPVITVQSGVSLVNALVDACPKDASAGVKKALKYAKSRADKAATDLADRHRALGVYTEEDSRDLDNEADRAWGGTRFRFVGMSMLSPDKYPKAKLAAELDARLFGAGGTEFLRADYPTQSTAMGAILERIDADGLQADIDAVAGPEFLKAVREIQPRYAAMVSERLRRDKAMGQNLLETTRGLQEAIVNYARKVIGTIEHDDPATTEWARLALLPIANHRDANVVRGQRGVAEDVGAPVEAGEAAEGAKKPG